MERSFPGGGLRGRRNPAHPTEPDAAQGLLDCGRLLGRVYRARTAAQRGKPRGTDELAVPGHPEAAYFGHVSARTSRRRAVRYAESQGAGQSSACTVTAKRK